MEKAFRPKALRLEGGHHGFVGTFFLIVFVAFNALMLFWLLSYWGSFGDGLTGASEAERAGATIGATVTIGIILVIWALGAMLTGLLAMATRKPKTDLTAPQSPSQANQEADPGRDTD